MAPALKFMPQKLVPCFEMAGYRFEIPMNVPITRLTFRRSDTPQPVGVIEGPCWII
jgi:hypothetical protein